MKNIITIFKKELTRFFTDKRTLLALILPGILLYVMYSIMGSAMSDTFVPDEEYIPIVSSVNTPNSLSPVFDNSGVFEINDIEAEEIEFNKKMLQNSEIDLVIVFPEKFDEAVAAYGPHISSLPANIEIFYNSSDTESASAYQLMITLLDQYESMMANKFDINRPSDDNIMYDLAKEEDVIAMVFSSVLPMLLLTFLFSGCMAVAPESISGEKERGTIAALLITPTKRSHIAIGKILALSVMALISGASSTIGVILSLPKLLDGAVEVNGSIYGIFDYTMLAVVILSTVLLLITIISIISAYAKTVKEASTYVTPLMVLSMVVGLSGMFGTTASNSLLYIIPIYNSVQSMIGIFSFNISILNMTVTVITNILFTVVGVFVLTRMFNSEKIIFNK